MPHASQGMRNALRKGSDAVVHHSGHNGPGGATTANPTSRSLHLSSNLRGLSRIAQSPFSPINTLESIRPRNPPHRLFSITKNVFQKLFTRLSTPGFRAPTYLAQGLQTGTRSLHNAAFRGNSIPCGLSLAARASLKNNALRRQASMFLPRAPNTPPPRYGGAIQVGLGTARNFTTGRPIFQQVAENIPITGRALYEADWDLKMRKRRARVHIATGNKPTQKSKEMSKPSQRSATHATVIHDDIKDDVTPPKPDLDHYFPLVDTVTTFLYVPLAPRTPLSQHPAPDEFTLLPLPDIAALHSSYTTHKLRVTTLFTRLEQADVWSRGVSYCCYSQGLHHQIQSLSGEKAGVCTNIKLVFQGWTKAEVMNVIGESGTGWCALEEVFHDQVWEDSDGLSEASLSLDSSLSRAVSPTISEGADFSESFVMPKLAFSSSFLASGVSHSSSSSPSEGSSGFAPSGLTNDDSNEELSSLSSRSTSYSDLSDFAG